MCNVNVIYTSVCKCKLHIKAVLKHLFPFHQSVDFAAQVKALQEQNAEMEKKMSELKIQIQVIAVLLHVCLE